MKISTAIVLTLSALSSTALATPFDNCPTQGFLVQDQVANLYGVNLAGGYQQNLAPAGWTSAKLNALAFNSFDNYLYAYSYGHDAIVRIGQDYTITALTGPMGKGAFFVGDIATDENQMYLYNKSLGMFQMALDPAASNFSEFVKVSGSQAMGLTIFDLAFHPIDGFAYAVDRNGELWRITASSGETQNLGNIGETGTFGAAYFDGSGKLYISRNNDGHVFQIDIASGNATAKLFFVGPASSNNDGARCAFAPLIKHDMPSVNFGDAPDTYGTTLAANGARHGNRMPSLSLGNTVTYDADAFLITAEIINDNDGVQFLTDLRAGQTALLELTASAPGVASAWIDFNGNGTFDSSERVITDRSLQAGPQVVQIAVPSDAREISTWSRIRFSTESGLNPTGGAADGEVEDYPVAITRQDATTTYYPRENGFATLAFEDNWPLVGDYDMNDLVVQYRLSKKISGDQLVSVTLEGQVVAMGASYHNGFALRLSGLKREHIDESNIEYTINGANPRFSPLEPERSDAILIVAEDLKDYATAGESCRYYRTEQGCGSAVQMQFSITAPMQPGVNASSLGEFPLDPFLFATPGLARNYVFGEAPGRRFEIHLKNQAPTEAFQDNFFGRGDDSSNPVEGEYFVNANGMPWAMNIPYAWKHPIEYMDIKWAYPEFHEHVKSRGELKKDWYLETKANRKNLFEK